jgi:ATP-binding protein involved in chromosome partitioning
MISKEEVIGILRLVKHPDTGKYIVGSGAVRDVKVEPGRIVVDVRLPVGGEASKRIIEEQCRKVLGNHIQGNDIEVVVDVVVGASEDMAGGPSAMPGRAERGPIPEVEHAVAVASGKGGVGKSTVSVNLAVTLSEMGLKTGLFDADIYGPNLPCMLGIEEEQPMATVDRKIAPIEKYGLRIMSMGLIARKDQAIVWRGPMVSKAIGQLLSDVEWGDLDYLIIDLPPGTGDAQLTLSQRLSLAGAVMVTTPQEVSLSDVWRGIRMFQRVQVPILGLVENMAYFTCPACGTRTDIFPGNGVQAMIEDLSIPLLGRIPVDPEVSSGGDSGQPVTVTEPNGVVAKAFCEIAGALLESIVGR